MVVEPVSTTDMAMGAVMASGRLARRSWRLAGRVTGTLGAPLVRLAVDPPVVPHAWRPVRRLEGWGRDWQAHRSSLVRAGIDATTEVAANAAHVVLPMVDLTPVVQGVLDRLDLASVVAQVIDELDVGVVLDDALREVDLTEVVTQQVDLGAVVGSALGQVDLTEVVLTRVDLHAVVTAALDTLDLTSLVQQRVDLATLAERVMEDIDLPEIIQESTGSVASEAVQSARLAGVDADVRISRFADRMLFRVRGRGLDSGARLEGDPNRDEEGSS